MLLQHMFSDFARKHHTANFVTFLIYSMRIVEHLCQD